MVELLMICNLVFQMIQKQPTSCIIRLNINQRLLSDYNNLLFYIKSMDSYKSPVIMCYDCSSTENLRISSEFTSICQKCYQRSIAQIKYYKKYKELEPEIDQITTNIFLGNQDAAISQSTLEQHEITAICACGSHLETPFIDQSKYAYKQYEIDDAPKQTIIHLFDDHYRWMKEMLSQGRKILMHCSAGVSRSASFTIAFFMRENGLSFEQSLQFVRSKRVYVCPNSGFVAQLQAYQKQLIELKSNAAK